MMFRLGQEVKRETPKFFFQGHVIGLYCLDDGRFGCVVQNGTNIFMGLEEELQNAEPVPSTLSKPVS